MVTQLFSLFSCTQLDTGPPERVCPDPWRPDSCRWDRNAIGLFWTQVRTRMCAAAYRRACGVGGGAVNTSPNYSKPS